MANKTVIDLLEDFSFRHAKIDQETERRMKSDAQIMGLEEQKRALLAEKLKRAFLAEDATGFDAEIMELERRQEEIARKKGLMVPYACAACRDTGLVGRKYCTCFLREVYQTIYGAVDVDTVAECFGRADMSVFDGKKELAMGRTQRSLAELAYGICKKYVDSFPQTPRLNLLLRGKAGLGKSYLLRCIAAAAREKGVDVLVGIGPLSKEIVAGYGEGGLWFETNQQAIGYLKETLREGDAVLVKGSRGMKTDQIVAALKE